MSSCVPSSAFLGFKSTYFSIMLLEIVLLNDWNVTILDPSLILPNKGIEISSKAPSFYSYCQMSGSTNIYSEALVPNHVDLALTP